MKHTTALLLLCALNWLEYSLSATQSLQAALRVTCHTALANFLSPLAFTLVFAAVTLCFWQPRHAGGRHYKDRRCQHQQFGCFQWHLLLLPSMRCRCLSHRHWGCRWALIFSSSLCVVAVATTSRLQLRLINILNLSSIQFAEWTTRIWTCFALKRRRARFQLWISISLPIVTEFLLNSLSKY